MKGFAAVGMGIGLTSVTFNFAMILSVIVLSTSRSEILPRTWSVSFVGIFPFTPHKSILYPVWVSQLTAYNVDAMKYFPKLSYFTKWSSSFHVSAMSLDPFHLNGRVSILWKSTVVTRDTAVASDSEAEEGS